MDLSSLLHQLPQDTLLVLLAYVALGGLYLVVIPRPVCLDEQALASHGKAGAFGIYGMVFFFPGMILFAFLNFRLSGERLN